MPDLRLALEHAPLYRFFRRILAGDRVWRDFVARHLRPTVGGRFLDIGCGPAEILRFLPAVDYLGFDPSAAYVDLARRRFGDRASFLCRGVEDGPIDRPGSFGLALAFGVVHHLDDELAERLFALAREALAPDGRLVTFDGCYVPGQSRIARHLLDHDRGRFVRDQEAYRALAASSFADVKVTIRHDLLRIPYTHIVMECSGFA